MNSFFTFVLLLLIGLFGEHPVHGSRKKCGSARDYQPRTRDYWLVIQEQEWNYLPNGNNQIKDTSLEDNVFAEMNEERIGAVYLKALYIEYTKNFGEVKPRSEDAMYTGNLGPTLRAVVGDTLRVHVLNKGTKQYSAHAHGLKFAKEHEGFFHNDGEGEFPGDLLDPGENHTYIWEAAERSGPAKNDFSSVVWAYHSHVNVPTDIYSGLVGPIVVVNPKYIVTTEEADTATPCDIDREVFLYFSVSDENQNKLFDDNFAQLSISKNKTEGAKVIEDEGFVESNLMHGMNGYLYGNMPEITMKIGDRVRWYLFSFGTEVDLHTVAWHGHTVETSLGKRAASIFLSPASFEVVDMVPDVAGKWLVECHTHDHLDAGMQHFYNVVS